MVKGERVCVYVYVCDGGFGDGKTDRWRGWKKEEMAEGFTIRAAEKETVSVASVAERGWCVAGWRGVQHFPRREYDGTLFREKHDFCG